MATIPVEDFLKSCDLGHLISTLAPVCKTIPVLYNLANTPDFLKRYNNVHPNDHVVLLDGLRELKSTLLQHGRKKNPGITSSSPKPKRPEPFSASNPPIKSRVAEAMAESEEHDDEMDDAEEYSRLVHDYANEKAIILQEVMLKVRESKRKRQEMRKQATQPSSPPLPPGVKQPPIPRKQQDKSTSRVAGSGSDEEFSGFGNLSTKDVKRSHVAQAQANVEDSDDDDDDDSGHSYENEAAIELATIDGLQLWMHGDIDRDEAEKRLAAKGSEKFYYLVRQKGNSGRIFVFSMYCGPEALFTHTMIQFTANQQVAIDGKPLTEKCRSLKDAVKVMTNLNSNRYNIPEKDIVGLEDFLLTQIETTKSIWLQPNLSREEARKYLLSKTPGTFVIRDSKHKQALALSFRTKEKDQPPDSKAIMNVIVHENPDGYLLHGTKYLARSLQELVRSILLDIQMNKAIGITTPLHLP